MKLADVFLILSIILVGAGVYLSYGLEKSILSLGLYFGLIAFTMGASTRQGG